MSNIKLRLTRRWPFPGKDRIASWVFSENRENKARFPHFEGILPLPWGLMWCDTRSSLDWQLFVMSEYESNVAGLIESLLKPSDAFLDVGANAGVHTLNASRQVGVEGHVIALEPNPTMFQRLQDNLKLNRISNVVPIACALGEANGRAQLAVLPDHFNQGLSTFVDKYNGSKKVEVDIVTGDSLLAKHADRVIALIKIDTEGWEVPVLRGLQHTIRHSKPAIIFEYNCDLWNSGGYSLQEAIDLLEGYQLLEITYRGLIPIKDLSAFAPKTDILAMHNLR